ncbi:MAG TPA: hypothetical protein VHF06_23650, partial [Pseudonocardiaceae bacterium]|nr:hypothetical protein [Pseudonocardiaceae bacterium]
VMRILHTLPVPAQQAIVESLTPQERAHYNVGTVHAASTSTMSNPTMSTTMPNAAETTSVMPPLGRRPSPTPRNYQEPPAGFQGRLPQ